MRAYASSGTLRDPAAQADAAERYLAQGFPALKLRFHRGDWRDDVRALEAVRARVGDRLELMVDCNQGWRLPWDTEAAWTFKDALTVARELERLEVYWMEEPLHRADHDGMRALREATDVRIAGGRDDAPAARAARSHHAAAAWTCCSRTRRWSAASPACGASPSWRRSTTSSSHRTPGPTAWA